ncbi:MAG: DUF4976 domain-containing protein [Calditrichaeota bacterium]|nr:MAG: DUF4976 domain-containing protein [Calditrichota bacterium]
MRYSLKTILFHNAKREFISTFAAIILVLFLTSCALGPDEKRPNILFISIDDLRPDLGCYGNTEIQTPNIDKFAATGVVFTQNHCQSAVCAPSRASLMTGLRPDSTRVWHLGDKFREINPDAVTIPQYFKKFGYHTVSLGKIFHNFMPDSVSFDEPDLRPPKYRTQEMVKRDAETFYFDKKIQERQVTLRAEKLKRRPAAINYADGWNVGPAWEDSEAPDSAFYDGAQTDLAIETLKRLKTSNEPFFMALGYYRPHLPFTVPKKYWDLYDPQEITPAINPFLPEDAPVFTMNSMYELRGYEGFEHIKHPSQFHIDDEAARRLKHGYYASVSYVDACIGKLLHALDALGLAENTIIVVFGDHGWKLGEHNSWCKQTNYNIDTHAPLIISAPDVKAKGQASPALTELVDIFPTLCDMAGIKKPTYLQGTSLSPLLNQPEKKWKDAVFSQFHRRPRITPDGKRYMGYSMRTQRYHYVEWYYWDNKTKLATEFVARELYDHESDPNENKNIAQNTENMQIIDRLSKKLKAGWRAARPTI